MKTLNTIIKQCIEGDETAQRELYVMHRVKWYMQCLRYGKNRYEADDILQEGLIQIYKDLHQFDEKRAGFMTWTSRLISHAALRYLKKNSWQNTFVDIDEVSNFAETNEAIHQKLNAKELTALIQSLPLGYRIVFNMHEIEGYNHPEIANKLNITIGTSKSQLSKARKMLQKKLEFQLTEYSRNER